MLRIRFAERISAALIVCALCCSGLSCRTPGLELYDETLYDYMKYATPESLEAHLDTLEGIVDRAEERDERPPPGLCAEYGYYVTLAGEPERGMALLLREKDVYPESGPFVDVLIRMTSGQPPLANPPEAEPAPGEGESESESESEAGEEAGDDETRDSSPGEETSANGDDR